MNPVNRKVQANLEYATNEQNHGPGLLLFSIRNIGVGNALNLLISCKLAMKIF